MSSRFAGRHRKSRMPSRRTLSAVTGVAAVVVAVTTGAVPLPFVAPGGARGADPGVPDKAEPVSLYVGPGAPSAPGRHAAAGYAGAGVARSGAGSAPGSTAPGASATGQPTASARPSAFGGPPHKSPEPSTSSPAPSHGGPVPSLPVPLPTATPTPSLPSVPTPSLPTLPAFPLPTVSLPPLLP